MSDLAVMICPDCHHASVYYGNCQRCDFRSEPRGPACEDCGGSGQVSSGHLNDPRSRDVDCDSCVGSGMACEECRFSKHTICQEHMLEQVEAFYE
jgi:hypothetical protein